MPTDHWFYSLFQSTPGLIARCCSRRRVLHDVSGADNLTAWLAVHAG